jgi:hypothetical protein
VLYLGQAEGFTVLYDPRTMATWRLPTSNTVVRTGGTLNDVEQVPDDC